MRAKASPDLLRQTKTRFWQFNLYIQKPLDISYCFISFFKVCFLLEIFFSALRSFPFNTRSTRIFSLFRKKIHRLMHSSSYKFINMRIIKKSKILVLLCNFGSRSLMFPNFSIKFKYKSLIFFFSKKLRYLNSMYYFINRMVYTNSFFEYIKKFKTNNKNKQYNLQYFFLKMSTRYFIQLKYNTKFYSFNFFKQWNTLHTFQPIGINKRLYKEEKRWLSNTHTIYKQTLKGLKNKKNFISITTYYNINKIKTVNIRGHFTSQNKIKYRSLVFYCLNMFIIRNNHLKNNILNYIYNFRYLSYIRVFIKQLRIFKLIFLIFNLKKINLLTLYNNNSIKIQHKTHKQKQDQSKNRLQNFTCVRSIISGELSFCFWYFQLFNKLFEHKLAYFLETFCNLNYFFCILQYEYTYPNATFLVNLFQRRIQLTTKFLKFSKFYTNFLNLLPLVQTFQSFNILSDQVALELTRTHKHWKVIRGLESLLMQAFIQVKHEPFVNRSELVGLRFSITGRPQKSSRSQYFSFQFGQIKKSSFYKYNVFKSFSSSNAKIGAFGITFIAAT